MAAPSQFRDVCLAIRESDWWRLPESVRRLVQAHAADLLPIDNRGVLRTTLSETAWAAVAAEMARLGVNREPPQE